MKNRDVCGVEQWIDEHGKTVHIASFFSDIYIDEEAAQLTRRYDIWQFCNGEQRPGLGSAERESLVAKLLVLVRASAASSISLVGVKKIEFERLAHRSNELWEVRDLVNSGYLRVKLVKGTEVIFPTEKLLKVWGMPRRAA